MSDEILLLSDLAKSIKLGVYEHFKGGRYEVLGVARHSEDIGQEFVVYKSLKTNYIWIRPIKMFLENIDRKDYKGLRFTLIE